MTWWKKILFMPEETAKTPTQRITDSIALHAAAHKYHVREEAERHNGDGPRHFITISDHNRILIQLIFYEEQKHVVISIGDKAESKPLDEDKITQQVNTWIERYALEQKRVKDNLPKPWVKKEKPRSEQNLTKDDAREYAEALVWNIHGDLSRLKFKFLPMKYHLLHGVPYFILIVVDKDSKSGSMLRVYEPAYLVIEVKADGVVSVHMHTRSLERSQSYTHIPDASKRIREDLAIMRAQLDSAN